MAQHHVSAQKAIDGLRLAFKNNKKPAVTALRPNRQSRPSFAICDCCGQNVTLTTAIDSGQNLCGGCLQELRG